MKLRYCLVFVAGLVMIGCDDPFAPTSVAHAVDVTAGVAHTCAIVDDGRAFCWGLNDEGQLGTGDKSNRLEPAPVTGDLRFRDIAAGEKHTCALTTEGRAYCWGWNVYYERGNAFDGRSTEPVPVTGQRTYSAIDAGRHHTCAIATDGEVFCWGNNRYGQLGDGTYNTSVEPVPIVSASRATDIAAGAFHSCMVTLTGSGNCWGANEHGQLGAGLDAVTVNAPVPVRGGPAFQQMAGGQSHTCAIALDQRAHCWGSNVFGELGDRATFQQGLPGAATPVAVTLAGPARAIAAGLNASCLAAVGGLGYCWGHGADGQLGNGATSNHSVPQPLHLQPGTQHTSEQLAFSTVSGSLAGFMCGLADGSVYCWGSGPNGELGDDQTRYAPMPQRVRLP